MPVRCRVPGVKMKVGALADRLRQVVRVAVAKQLTDNKHRSAEKFVAELVIDRFVKVLEVQDAKVVDAVQVSVASDHGHAALATVGALVASVQVTDGDREERLRWSARLRLRQS